MTTSKPARVLVVDDSEVHVRLLERVLHDEGYECLADTCGRDALARAAVSPPDLMLLDVDLPDLSGLDVCRTIKAGVDTRLIPVLIITGAADGDSHLAALEAGADDFLAKPVALAELRARLRSAVRMTHYIHELDNATASIVMLGAAIEARDRLTEGHCERLADMASRLGRRLGLAEDDVQALDRGGFLHDLGKVCVPDAILFKPAHLTPAEFEIVKTHPLAGDRICAPLRSLERVRPIIRSHHEMLDGTGYPQGLRGSAVPLLAQIAAIADVYDALTTDRPYRRALSPARAYEILQTEAAAGKRDGVLVAEFIGLCENARERPGSDCRPKMTDDPRGDEGNAKRHLGDVR